MSGMLNTLLDINQIEAGTVRPEIVKFPDQRSARPAEGRVHLSCAGARAQLARGSMRPFGPQRSATAGADDPQPAFERVEIHQSAARCCSAAAGAQDMLSIEIWDTGIGIPDEELQSIFEEYHQLDNAARERSRGLGLGLSIVQRLGNLLGHRVRVRSRSGQGLGLRHRGRASHERNGGAARTPARHRRRDR